MTIALSRSRQSATWRGQCEHECLELGEGLGVEAVVLQQEHQADLCHKKVEACAVEALSDRGNDDWEKKQVEEIRAVLALGVEDNPETRGNDCYVDGSFS